MQQHEDERREGERRLAPGDGPRADEKGDLVHAGAMRFATP